MGEGCVRLLAARHKACGSVAEGIRLSASTPMHLSVYPHSRASVCLPPLQASVCLASVCLPTLQVFPTQQEIRVIFKRFL